MADEVIKIEYCLQISSKLKLNMVKKAFLSNYKHNIFSFTDSCFFLYKNITLRFSEEFTDQVPLLPENPCLKKIKTVKKNIKNNPFNSCIILTSEFFIVNRVYNSIVKG